MSEVAEEQGPETEHQEFGGAQRLIASLIDEPCPIGFPLTAKFRQGFGFKTIGHRLPVILTKVIDQLSREKNKIGDSLGMDARTECKSVVGALAKLKNEMQTNKSITITSCSVWNSYLELVAERYFDKKVEDVKWYFAPWLYVECYMYKRLHDAFQASKYLKRYDVFQKQKDESWEQSVEPASIIGEFVKTLDPTDDNLQQMLEISLWGNRCDLSISTGEDNSQKNNLIDQLQDLKKCILCDESAKFWSILKSQKADVENNTISIGYVLDNAGFELFTDLCFADALMSRVDRIDFHFKVIPWFVSDARIRDFNWLLESMACSPDKLILIQLAQKWRGYISSGKWTLRESQFWTYPHAFYEMSSCDPQLYNLLGQYTHLIFKGDLNYRKLVGDINWRPDTPFKESLQGFAPSPLIVLRTLKADCISGLRSGLAEEIAAVDPDWMVTGTYGVIQQCGTP